MNSAIAPAPRTMILIGVLATTTLIGLTHTAPLSYATYGRNPLSAAARPQVLALLDQRMPDLENEMFGGNDPESTVVRTKRIGSLSIVNPLDVLRQRVSLELARRKAMQDQRQVDENRRLLESIGKRSISNIDLDLARIARMRNNLGYAVQDHDRSRASNRIPGRMQDWFDVDDPVFQDQDDQTHRGNELRLL